MTKLTVGTPYFSGGRGMPEGVHVLGLSDRRMEVIVALGRLKASEVEDWKRRPIKLGVTTHEELLVLLMHCAGIVGWADAPFDIRVCPPGEQGLPPAQTTLMTCLLVAAETSVVRAIRVVSVSAAFMAEVRAVLARQLQLPFAVERYHYLAYDYQARYPTDRLVKRAARVETLGAAVQPPATPPQMPNTASWLSLIDDASVREVVIESVESGEAVVVDRHGEWWYIDTQDGDEMRLTDLRYDKTIGMYDMTAFTP